MRHRFNQTLIGRNVELVTGSVTDPVPELATELVTAMGESEFSCNSDPLPQFPD